MESLEEKFDLNSKTYESGEGEIVRGDMLAKAEVGYVKVDNDFADTDYRSFVRVHGEENAERSIVMLPGWGETVAQMMKKFLTVVMQVLGEDFGQTDIVGVHTVGRCVSAVHNGRAGGVGLRDRVEDARMTVEALDREGKLAKEIVFIAHSAGFLDVLSIMRSMGDRVKRVVGLNPMVDVGMELGFATPKFLWMVKRYFPATLWNAYKKDVLHVRKEDHYRVMFSGDECFEHYIRGVDDSAKAFFDMMLKHRHWFDDLFEKGGKAEGTRFDLLLGRYDKVIPKRTVLNWMARVEDRVELSLDCLPNFAHSIPYNMSEYQMNAMGLYLKNLGI